MSHKHERVTERHETLDIHRGFCFYIVRHGQPTLYAEPNAPLTPLGREQARNFATELAPKLLNASHRINLRIFSGTATRQIETAITIEDELQRLIRQTGRPTPNLLIQERAAYRFLSPRGLIKLFAKGIPKKDAYQRWLDATDDELKSYGAETPKEISSNIMWFVKALSERGRQAEDTPLIPRETIYVWVTSETIHGAILKNLLPEYKQVPQIDFCEVLKIDLEPYDDNALFTFRGEMFMRPLSYWS